MNECMERNLFQIPGCSLIQRTLPGPARISERLPWGCCQAHPQASPRAEASAPQSPRVAGQKWAGSVARPEGPPLYGFGCTSTRPAPGTLHQTEILLWNKARTEGERRGCFIIYSPPPNRLPAFSLRASSCCASSRPRRRPPTVGTSAESARLVADGNSLKIYCNEISHSVHGQVG